MHGRHGKMSPEQYPPATTRQILTDQPPPAVKATNQSEASRVCDPAVNSSACGRGSLPDRRNPHLPPIGRSDRPRDQGLRFVDIPLEPATAGFLHRQSWRQLSNSAATEGLRTGEPSTGLNGGFTLHPQVRGILSQHAFIPGELGGYDVRESRPTMARIPAHGDSEQYAPTLKRQRTDSHEIIRGPGLPQAHVTNLNSAASLPRTGLWGRISDLNPWVTGRSVPAAENSREYSPRHPMSATNHPHAPGATQHEIGSRQLVNPPSNHGGIGPRGGQPHGQHAAPYDFRVDLIADPQYGDPAHRHYGPVHRHPAEVTGRGNSEQQSYSPRYEGRRHMVHDNRNFRLGVKLTRPGDPSPGPDNGHHQHGVDGRFGPPSIDYQVSRDPWAADPGRPDPRRHNAAYSAHGTEPPSWQTRPGRVPTVRYHDDHGKGDEVPLIRSSSTGHIEPGGEWDPIFAPIDRKHRYPSRRDGIADHIQSTYGPLDLQRPRPHSAGNQDYRDDNCDSDWQYGDHLGQWTDRAVRRVVTAGPNRGSPRGPWDGPCTWVVDGPPPEEQGQGPGLKRTLSAVSLLHPFRAAHQLTQHPSSERSPHNLGPDRPRHEENSSPAARFLTNTGHGGRISLPPRHQTLSDPYELSCDDYTVGRRKSTTDVAIDRERRRASYAEYFKRRVKEREMDNVTEGEMAGDDGNINSNLGHGGGSEGSEDNAGLPPSLTAISGPPGGKNMKSQRSEKTRTKLRGHGSRKSSGNDAASGGVSDGSSGGGSNLQQSTMILSQNGKIRGGLRPAGQGVVEMDLMELKLPDLTVATSAGLVEEVKNSFASVCKARGDVSVLMRVAVGIERTSDFADPVHNYSWSTHLGCIQKLLGLLPVERKGCDYHDVTIDEIVRFWAVRLIAYAKKLGLPAASTLKATTYPGQ